MAVSYDNSSISAAAGNVTSFTFNHTSSVGVKGVIVFVFDFNNVIMTSSVNYGDTTMTKITGAVAKDVSGEPCYLQTFFLGSGISSGEKTITVSKSEGNVTSYAICVSFLANGNTELSSAVLLDESGTYSEQNVDDGSPGTNSLRVCAGFSGNSPLLTAGENSTYLVGVSPGGFSRSINLCRETTAGQGSRPVGFSYAISDDRAAVHIAVKEIVAATNTSNFFQLF